METTSQEFIGTVSNGVIVLPSDSNFSEGSLVRVTELALPDVRQNGQNAQPITRQPRKPGSAKDKLVIHADDEEHLRDFQEYMP